jgi:hypothetical protein
MGVIVRRSYLELSSDLLSRFPVGAAVLPVYDTDRLFDLGCRGFLGFILVHEGCCCLSYDLGSNRYNRWQSRILSLSPRFMFN